ncbi:MULTISPECIES: AMP-binding protein [unclassified Nocardioides]|uniref:AMP-binding protein n=1 Tax=unclassified Nocardioides TaxID=2615069 RepID=UPI0006F930EC|nr:MULTISPECIES: AMP-binding protein [unclassified Nocardioides]KQY56401.1 AMP-dependent synthetase [Nocardioides sp. Root140]KRF14264.1 AMP-dependent synthetase [Nocardioides sp. Soil796]
MPQPTTVCAAFQRTVTVQPSAVALRTPGDAVSVTWQEYADRVRKVAAGLAKLGLERGDTLALMLTNRPEFAWVDAGAMHLGVIAFSIYNTSSPDQIDYLFGNAENTAVVTETALLPAILASGISLEHVIVVDGKPEGATMSLEELEASGDPDFDFEAAWRAVQPDDVLTLIYTSGTTGPPKGVQLTHANIIDTVESALKVVPVEFGDRITSFLPAAHIADRASAQYFAATSGVQVTYVDDPRAIAAALPDARPTIWFAVPRVWEKIKMAVEAKLAAEESPVKKKMFAWALELAAMRAEAVLTGKQLGTLDRLQVGLADKLVLSKVREALGMSELKWAWSGAAAIAPETLKFFMGLGVNVCELWGMSELSGAGTINPPGKAKVGSVGPGLPGTEIRIAEDGEVLFRGPGVMPGYRKDPEKTREAIDEDGWLHTGDVGTLDADGYLTIVDRKKELIISSSGKNMSPSNIENTLKVTTPLAATITVIGDGRPYNVALVTLDPDAAAAFAEKAGVAADPATLAKHPELLAAVQAGVDAGNAKLSRVEQVKKVEVLPEFWLPGSEVLTPTLKLRRKPINDKYADVITRLYE